MITCNLSRMNMVQDRMKLQVPLLFTAQNEAYVILGTFSKILVGEQQ